MGAESKEYVAQEKCHRITSSYNAAIEAVDNLIGIDSTRREQENRLITVSSENKKARMRILEYENKLIEHRERIDAELSVLLSDVVVTGKYK